MTLDRKDAFLWICGDARGLEQVSSDLNLRSWNFSSGFLTNYESVVGYGSFFSLATFTMLHLPSSAMENAFRNVRSKKYFLKLVQITKSVFSLAGS